jgi:hypothetical protein
MNRKLVVLLLVVLLMLSVTTLVSASPNAFSLSWWTVDGGGGTSQGGDFDLSGTIGQPDGKHLMSGGKFNLVGGFWADDPAIVLTKRITYLPLISR